MCVWTKAETPIFTFFGLLCLFPERRVAGGFENVIFAMIVLQTPFEFTQGH
jgi:hypothetical protein